ncbi:MAG: TrkH family potassium uptake protein [Bacteroidota bacterium]
MAGRTFWDIRQRLNLRIFRSRKGVLFTLRFLSLIISLLALAAIVYYHGYPKTAHSLLIYNSVLHFSFSFYLLKFLLRLIYNFQPGKFLKDNWFEGLMMLLILLEGLGLLLFRTDLVKLLFRLFGLDEFTMLSTLFVQLYFLLIVGIEAGKASQKLSGLNITPQRLLAASFLLLIAFGALLLSLPEMTVGGKIRPVDAIFTAASASCVTGLTVVDTATFFTLKGKVLIMLLIQLGGLNILSFATLFATFYRTSASIRYKSLIKDFLSTEKISDTRLLLKELFLFSLVFELAGTLALFLFWDPGPGMETRDRLFYALFHSVSAFNNAGFSLFTENLYQGVIRYAFAYHVVIACLIFFGGIGFMNINNTGRFLKERFILKKRWARLNTGTRLSLSASLILILGGMILFLLAEWDRSLDGYTAGGKLITAFFQSITTRTAGFNTVDTSRLTLPVIIGFILLMFIGASSGSTGGGIKTTTFALIVKSAIATIRGEEHVVVYKRTIPFSTIDRSYSIALFTVSLIFISTLALSVTDPGKGLTALVFEEVSAISTVGLSLGITADLSTAGKAILILSMFIGRIGTLTMALILTRKVESTSFRYASANIVVG